MATKLTTEQVRGLLMRRLSSLELTPRRVAGFCSVLRLQPIRWCHEKSAVGSSGWSVADKDIDQPATTTVREERQPIRGDPIRGHNLLAQVWHAVLCDATQQHVPPFGGDTAALMLALLKIMRRARPVHTPDDLTDARVYLDFADEITADAERNLKKIADFVTAYGGGPCVVSDAFGQHKRTVASVGTVTPPDPRSSREGAETEPEGDRGDAEPRSEPTGTVCRTCGDAPVYCVVCSYAWCSRCQKIARTGETGCPRCIAGKVVSP